MASKELKSFLSSVSSGYLDYANAIYEGQFTSQAELGAAERIDLVELGIPKGAAGLIIAAAKGIGDFFYCLAFLLSAFRCMHCFQYCGSLISLLRSIALLNVNHAQIAGPDTRAMQGCCTISFVLYGPSLSCVLHNCMY